VRQIRWMWLCLIFPIWLFASPAGAVELGISQDGAYFTLDGVPTYLNGISYYGVESVSQPRLIGQDLNDMARDGLNWIRVWVFWSNGGENVSVLTPEGAVREPYMSRLKRLITEGDSRGMVVDVTMCRGGPQAPGEQAAHLACARQLAEELKPYRNVYFDMANERDVGDARHVTLRDVGELIRAVKAIDPKRLCTASGNPGSRSELEQYIAMAHCDFLAPHLSRNPESPSKTVSRVRELAGWMAELNRRVPIHLQEPFRRGYNSWQPAQEDYYRDDSGAKVTGAAGWCLHNGSQEASPDHRPFRSFLMNEKEGRLYAQLDAVERDVARNISDAIGGTAVSVRRYQAEYPEQVAHRVGRKEDRAWSADPGRDSEGYLTEGPNIASLPPGSCEAAWKMSVNKHSGKSVLIARLEIRSHGRTVAQKMLYGADFPTEDAWNVFLLPFTSTGREEFEFRTYWPGKEYLKLDHITVTGPMAARGRPD
jgi:hypothetical protein